MIFYGVWRKDEEALIDSEGYAVKELRNTDSPILSTDIQRIEGFLRDLKPRDPSLFIIVPVEVEVVLP